MNKTAIKNFAIWARVNLIEAVKQRAYEYEITKDGANNKSLEAVGGRILTTAERDQRRALIDEISKKGFEQVMEEAAYTWFNRFIALRFMEVNGYLPARVRVFTNEEGEFKPEIMKEAMTVEIDGLKRDKVLDLIDKQNNEELFKYLLITQCNALGVGLPKMFERIEHWTELLFPANLLRADSVVGKMVTEIPEEDWQDAVQIIGWLYQYYNTELKDDTFAKLKKNIKISKDRIPAATQLFTPDWIVRYMVENSLGRLWLEGHPNDEMKAEWKYYLDEAKQDDAVEAQLAKIREEAKSLRPQDIKVIDPCMGSGHILVYAFDVLMQMYTASGWSERDAAKSIVENNLFGLDIDDRAGQLAYFAVMMKARKYNRRALTGGASGILPNVYAIQESNAISRFAVEDFCNGNAKALEEMNKLLRQMKDAKEYGSILDIKDIDFELLLALCDASADRITLYNNEIREDIVPLVKIAYIMAQKYDVVVTNPPYMGGGGMSAKLTEFVKNNYPDSKSDFFSVFIERCTMFAEKNCALVTPVAWMYNPRYVDFRAKQLRASAIISLIELGDDAFEAGFGTTCFVFDLKLPRNYLAQYIDVSSLENKELFMKERAYYSTIESFLDSEDKKVSYKLSKNLRRIIRSTSQLQSFAVAGSGLQTNDNARFIRDWFEVSINRIEFNRNSKDRGVHDKRWYPTVKNTSSRKWYGNFSSVVNWENDGLEIIELATEKYGSYTRTVKNMKYYFCEGLTWSHSTYGKPLAIRYLPIGWISNVEGPGIFELGNNMKYIMGLLNSKVAMTFFELTTGSIHILAGDMAKMPCILSTGRSVVEVLVNENLEFSKADWDSFETSWDFKKHPLV